MSSGSSPESSGSARPRRPVWRRWRRRLRLGALVAMLLVAVSVLGSVLWVRQSAREHVYPLADVPEAPVALVLGARVYPDGTPAPFLAARLELARELLAAGKVRAILVSGDHRSWAYDEPGAMSRWLVQRGVPARLVVQDHAGFDTYDSCSRARRVFGVDRTIVVTQSFHIARAVTVCRRVGLDAVGVGDDSVRRFERAWRWGGFREHFAAVKAVVDVWSGRDPVFLGPPESGVRDALAG